jgi:hypothetical protein
MRIVVNPRTGQSCWVEKPESGGSWSSGLVWFDSLPANRVWLDPFTLTGSDSLAVYERPGGRLLRVLNKDSMPGALRAVRQRGNMVLVEAVSGDPENYTATPIGWIRVRDSLGRLLLWLYDFDSC